MGKIVEEIDKVFLWCLENKDFWSDEATPWPSAYNRYHVVACWVKFIPPYLCGFVNRIKYEVSNIDCYRVKLSAGELAEQIWNRTARLKLHELLLIGLEQLWIRRCFVVMHTNCSNKYNTRKSWEWNAKRKERNSIVTDHVKSFGFRVAFVCSL